MRALVLSLPFLTFASIGCSAPVASPLSGSGDFHDAAEGASSAALIVLERTVGSDDVPHSSAVARVIRMRSGTVDEQTLQMLGATIDLPAVGSCGGASPLAATTVDLAEAEGPRAAELLDVGSLGLEAQGAQTTLEPRALPDIVDLVTGVFYSSRSAGLDALPSRGLYSVRATGTVGALDTEHTVPAFTVSATAPGEPLNLQVDGQDARGEGGIALHAGSAVELVWTLEATEPSDVVGVKTGSATGTAKLEPEDLVYVDLLPSSESPDPVGAVRCLFADHGAATLPATAFTEGDGELVRGTIVVHRLHRETFQVSSDPNTGHIDSGIVRFDFARAVEFSRR